MYVCIDRPVLVCFINVSVYPFLSFPIVCPPILSLLFLCVLGCSNAMGTCHVTSGVLLHCYKSVTQRKHFVSTSYLFTFVIKFFLWFPCPDFVHFLHDPGNDRPVEHSHCNDERLIPGDLSGKFIWPHKSIFRFVKKIIKLWVQPFILEYSMSGNSGDMKNYLWWHNQWSSISWVCRCGFGSQLRSFFCHKTENEQPVKLTLVRCLV